MSKKSSLRRISDVLAAAGAVIGMLTAPIAAAEAEGIPKVMNMATHGLGTIVYATGLGISKVLEKHMDAQIKVRPTSGPTEWLPQIKTGEIQLGVLSNYDALHGYLGDAGYERVLGKDGANIRLLTSGSQMLAAPLVASDSGINSCQDLKGKRVIDNYTGTAGVTAQSAAVIANCGLRKGDYKSVTIAGAPGKAVQALIDGTADAVASSAVGMGAIAELDAKRGARFISIDPSTEAMKRYNAHYPAAPLEVGPGKGKVGVAKNIEVAAFPFYLVAAQNLSDEAAYQIVKVLWEHNEELFPLHARLKDWLKQHYVSKDATIPYHPAAIKFYKEVGAWSPEMNKVQERLLAKQH